MPVDAQAGGWRERGGGIDTGPWWVALLACGSAYWPVAFEPSAMTSRRPHYCGHPHFRWHPPAPGGGGGSRMQLLPMASSPDGLISAPVCGHHEDPEENLAQSFKRGGGSRGAKLSQGALGPPRARA